MVRENILEGHRNSAYPRFLYAGFGARLLAFLIDIVVISSLSKILTRPLLNIFNISRTNLFFSPYNLMNLGLYLGYFFLLTKINKGQTLGKMIVGIRVIGLDDKDLSWIEAFYREVVGRFILKKIKIFYLLALFTRDKQHLADIFAISFVVNNEYFYEYKNLKNRAKEAEREEDYYRDREEILIARENELGDEKFEAEPILEENLEENIEETRSKEEVLDKENREDI